MNIARYMSIGNKEVHKLHEEDRILEEDYPMYSDFTYIADGVIVRADKNRTVQEFKNRTGAKEVRSFKMFAKGRAYAAVGDEVK